MKKMIIYLSALLLIFLCSCGDWSLSYSQQTDLDGWHAALDVDHHRAFVSDYTWDGDLSEEGRQLVIPETIEGCTVMKIGGYFGRGLPMPFSVSTPAAGGEEKEIMNPNNPKPLVFTLVINKSLSEIENVRMASNDDEAPDRIYLEEGDWLCAYDVYFRVKVDEENKTFYEKDGKLYEKSGNKLVTDFYWER